MTHWTDCLSHNAEHLEYCQTHAVEQLAKWSQDPPGQPFTVQQVVADITRDQRSIYILIHSEEGTRLIAPGAAIASKDFRSGTAVQLRTGLNVLNLSYGMYAASNYNISQIRWSAQESSIISHAGGRAIIAKAAGNDGIAIGGINSKGQRDYLNIGLIGRPSAIFVGALTTNGTTTAPARLATYSNIAGSNTTVQRQFVVVGVQSNQTGLAGTSFAAPIVAGYAAIVGNKFPTATPVQITNQLLNTARKDTVLNFNASTHGRGEASLTRALAPISIR